MSPASAAESSLMPEMDQLNVINNVLGELTSDDTSFITEMSALKRQTRAQKISNKVKNKLCTLFPSTNENLMSLLSAML